MQLIFSIIFFTLPYHLFPFYQILTILQWELMFQKYSYV
nr:MAG TPA: hypothetical protein [Bacteriophage sp.]